MTEGKCAIWGTPATISNDGGPPEYDSPRAGGKYRLGTLYSNDFLQCGDEFKIKLTSWLVEKRSSGIESPDFSGGGEFYHKISNRNYLATSERINKFLVYCSLRKMRPGQMVFGFSFVHENNPKLHARRKLVLKNADESIYAYTESLSLEDFRGFASFLRNSGYLTEGNELTEQAFKRIEEFECVNIDSKQSFVAMFTKTPSSLPFERQDTSRVLSAKSNTTIKLTTKLLPKFDDPNSSLLTLPAVFRRISQKPLQGAVSIMKLALRKAWVCPLSGPVAKTS